MSKHESLIVMYGKIPITIPWHVGLDLLSKIEGSREVSLRQWTRPFKFDYLSEVEVTAIGLLRAVVAGKANRTPSPKERRDAEEAFKEWVKRLGVGRNPKNGGRDGRT